MFSKKGNGLNTHQLPVYIYQGKPLKTLTLKPIKKLLPSNLLQFNKMNSIFLSLIFLGQTIAASTTIPLPNASIAPSLQARNDFAISANESSIHVKGDYGQIILAPCPKIRGDHYIVHCSSCGGEDKERPGQCQKLNPIGRRCRCTLLELNKTADQMLL